MTNVLMTPPKMQFFGSDGTTPNSLGLVYFYEAGAYTTPKNTYDADGNANTNPVVLDAAGRADIWLDGSYNITVKTAAGVTISTTPNVTAFAAGSSLDGITNVLYDTTTDNNLIIGRDTALTSGAKFNVFIGEGAGSTASTSATDNNTCVGYHAGTSITSGATNTLIGSTAGDAINSGSSNTALGYNTIGSLTTASNCTAVGWGALASATTSGSSTAVGSGALFSATGGLNTAIGLNAGYEGTPLTTGSTCTFLGANAQTNGAAYTNATAVGSGAIVTASNTVQLGDSSVTSVICGTSNTASIRALNTAKCYGSVSVSGGTPTLDESFNVTSITDTNTGDLTVTIATDFANTTYTIMATTELTATSYAVANDRKVYVRNATQAAGTFDLDCIDSTATTNVVKDPAKWHFVAYGKQ